jgi:RNA polymerase sigma factor (sigma-70 family)
MSKARDDAVAAALVHLKQAPFDDGAWGVLYRELWPYVVAVAASHLGFADEEIRDIAQEVFLRLLRAGPAAEFESAEALRAYLRIAALNEVRLFIRHRRRDARTFDASEGAEIDQLADAVDTDSPIIEEEALRELLMDLGEDDQKLVRLLVQGFTLGDVANSLGISYSAAGVRVHRLRRRLRNFVQHKNLPDANG